MAAATEKPLIYASISVTVPEPGSVPATQLPKVPAAQPVLSGYAVLPVSNTRSVTVLNTGGNPLLFGSIYVPDQSQWPVTWGGTGPGVIPIEGSNCARIPVAASLTIDIGSFQDRGNMGFGSTSAFNTAVPTLPPATEFPITVIFFSSIGGNTTGTVTYVNRLGQF